MMNLLKYLFASVAFILTATLCFSQKNEGKEVLDVDAILKSKNYTFIANSVTPTGSRMRVLTSVYDVVLRGDTLIVYLPFFGRAHSAPSPGEEGGIKFTSTNYEYAVNLSKNKKKWDVTIEPKDVPNGVKIQMQVSASGHTSLQVYDNRRSTISFTGKVRK